MLMHHEYYGRFFMKLFLDTANLESIKHWSTTNLIDGVTTNPTLLSKEKPKDPLALVKDICAAVGEDREVSVEVTEVEPNKVYEQAKKLADLAKNTIIKIPCHKDYVGIIDKLVLDEIPLNITLIFNPAQALMMAKLGVVYVSPFVGRIDDIGYNGIEVISAIKEIFSTHDFDTQILAASIRSVRHVQDAALVGADVATVPAEILEKCFEHPLTEKGITQFMRDWQTLQG